VSNFENDLLIGRDKSIQLAFSPGFHGQSFIQMATSDAESLLIPLAPTPIHKNL